MTIGWYVDDLKILHSNTVAVTRMVTWMDKKYPGVTATRGK